MTSNAFTEIYNKVQLHDQCLRNRASKQVFTHISALDYSAHIGPKPMTARAPALTRLEFYVRQMVSCMALPDQSVCDYNYYTDKADATAWCDWGGMPRKVMYPNYTDHRCVAWASLQDHSQPPQ